MTKSMTGFSFKPALQLACEPRVEKRLALRQLTMRDLTLRPMTVDDVGEAYLRWLHDPEIIRYLEVRHSDRSLPALRAYVARVISSPNEYFFAIVPHETQSPIGTIKLIVGGYRVASYGFMIGERSHWGRGFARAAQVGLIDFAFDELCLRRLHAGVYATNSRSDANFRRLGFMKEGLRRAHALDDHGKPVDVLEYGLMAEEWAIRGRIFDDLRAVDSADP